LGYPGGDTPPIPSEETTDSLCAGTVGGPATLKKAACMKWRKKTTGTRNETTNPGLTVRTGKKFRMAAKESARFNTKG
jgi:hypothetical protein